MRHELDVVASADTEHMMMECKFHSMQGKMSDVKVPLYIHSRFNDVKSQWLLNKQLKDKQLKVWVVTNTRFSPDALRYATCAGLNVLSWDYTLNKSIKVMIDRYRHSNYLFNAINKDGKRTVIRKKHCLVQRIKR